MTQNSKVLLNFMSKGIAAKRLLALAETVTQNMAGNTLFPTLGEKVKKVEVARVEYAKQWSLGYTGTSSQKAAANAAKAALQNEMKMLASDINYVAQGNRSMLLTTGYETSKDIISRLVLGAITGLYVTQGVNAGEVIVGFDTQGAIQGTGVDYAYTATPDSTTPWITIPNGKKTKLILKGLEPGSVLSVRAWATGPRNQSVVSQIVVTVSGFNQTAKKSRSGGVRKAA